MIWTNTWNYEGNRALRFLDLGQCTRALRTEISVAVERVLASGQYIGGEEVARFEHEFAAYCGAEYVVGTGNGLDALMLLLRACDIGPGDEVIVPSNTYIATWLAVSAVGASPVPVEPDPATFNLDPDRVKVAITKETRAILAVHLYGRRAEAGALNEIATHHGLRLLFDSAQAHGIPHSGDASAFSFYPSKNLGALGDAGAVVTNDVRLADRIRMLGNYGSRKKHANEERGVNSRLDPMQAAILRAKLAHLDTWNLRRREIAHHYQDALRGISELQLPDRSGNHSTNVWHIFPVLHPARDLFVRQLAEQGIETAIHYPQPPHLSEAYRDAGFRRGDFPIAEALASREVSLPLHPYLTDHEVDLVIGAVQEACHSEFTGDQATAPLKAATA